MDPITGGLAAAQFISGLLARKSASDAAQKSMELQQENLANSLAAARQSRQAGTEEAGGLRTDQFGNTTYYDPQQGRWITAYTPEQRAIIEGGQAQQERALARSAQAGEDYSGQRAGYLYNQPPSEAATRAEITRLISEARGEGDRALASMVKRQELRQSGNLPVIVNASTNLSPAPGQRLADTMLQARNQALTETAQRNKMHAEQYLPAMAQFEKTANTVQAQNPTGSSIVGIQQQQGQDYLKALEDFSKQQQSAYATGGKGELGASQEAITAQNVGASQQSAGLAALAKSLAASSKTGATPAPQASSTSVGAPDYSSPDTGSTPFTGAPVKYTDYSGSLSPDYTTKPLWLL